MSRKPDQELLSAYLDGELTPQELLHVEQWLSRDPEARQLLERLRRQRDLLASLPSVRCPQNLAPVVLETAEQRILLEGVPSKAIGNTPIRGKRGQLQELSSLARRIFRPRNLGWAILAGSIGLAILLLYPERRPREVGFHPMAPQEQEFGNVRSPVLAQKAVPELKAAPSMGGGPSVDSAPRRAQEALELREEFGPASQMERAEHAPIASAPEVPGAPSGESIASVPAGRSDAPPGPLVIEGIRPVGPSDRSVRQPSADRASQVQTLTAEIRCRLVPDAPLQTLVERLVARREAIPDNAVTGNPWEFAGHLQRGSASDQFVASDEKSGLPPGIHLQLTREDDQQVAVLEFSATEPQLKAVLDELAGSRSWVKDIQLPESLASLAQVTALAVGKPLAPGAISETESQVKTGAVPPGPQQRAVIPGARQLSAGVDGSQQESLPGQAAPLAKVAQPEGRPMPPLGALPNKETTTYHVRLVLVRPINSAKPAVQESTPTEDEPTQPQDSHPDSRPAQSSPAN
ncbi:anti-sigma factor family protein [Thermogutta sp.]|uniref:anti-sigma factor family protein n=1 Tax=Thermogutta sp. TaxID=1962930 RepID=UPI003C7B10D2